MSTKISKTVLEAQLAKAETEGDKELASRIRQIMKDFSDMNVLTSGKKRKSIEDPDMAALDKAVSDLLKTAEMVKHLDALKKKSFEVESNGVTKTMTVKGARLYFDRKYEEVEEVKKESK